MELRLKIGTETQTVSLEETRLLGELLPNAVPHGLTGEAEVRRALANPIGSPPLRQVVRPGETVAIVTSDITRPMPTWTVLPAVLEELHAAGVSMEDVTVVFGLGSHRPHTEAEQRKLLGDAWGVVRCVDSREEDCVSFGVTSRGTPVDIDCHVAAADRRVCLGNIEYHYFAGYSGGAKAIMPGVSTRAAIQANHSQMVSDDACAGKLAGNPVRLDIEEASALVGVDFLLNVVLDEKKEIVYAVAGEVTAAHRAGCAFLDTLYRKEIPRRADIVLVSQGGAPKDLNLYQTQKALDNAKHAVKDGGVIILVGSCREGLGESVFEEWMTTAPTAHSLIERIQREFRLGGHKAAAIAMVLERADIYLVSHLPEDLVRKLLMKPYPTAQAALEAAIAKCGPEATVLAMPYGGSTLPHAAEEQDYKKEEI